MLVAPPRRLRQKLHHDAPETAAATRASANPTSDQALSRGLRGSLAYSTRRGSAIPFSDRVGVVEVERAPVGGFVGVLSDGGVIVRRSAARRPSRGAGACRVGAGAR